MFVPADAYVPQRAAAADAARSQRAALLVWAITAAIALGLVGLILCAPLLLANGHTAPALTIYGVFSNVCHQLPERSFFIEGHKLAVCSRCTGLYTGFALSVLLYPLLTPALNRVDTPRRLWLVLSLIPVTIDWSLGFFDLWANTHTSRLLTGALFGGVAAIYVIPGLVDLGQSAWRSKAARRSDHTEGRATTADNAASLPPSAPSDYGSPSSRI
jgi:uncharacterized membrane protein